MAALSTWLEQTSLKEFFDGEMMSDALKNGTPNTRAELLGWLAEKMKGGEWILDGTAPY